MAMGIADVSVQPSIRPIDALNNTLIRQRLKVLIDRSVANFFTLTIQSVVDFTSRKVLLVMPEQFQNISTLTAQAHSQNLATFYGVVKRADWFKADSNGVHTSYPCASKHIHSIMVPFYHRLSQSRYKFGLEGTESVFHC